MDIDVNPNGSLEAIEGIFSPDGRVFGKMGHLERRGPLVGKNIPARSTSLSSSPVRSISNNSLASRRRLCLRLFYIKKPHG